MTVTIRWLCTVCGNQWDETLDKWHPAFVDLPRRHQSCEICCGTAEHTLNPAAVAIQDRWRWDDPGESP